MKAIGLAKWGAPASALAGVFWLLIWAHQREAHGVTQVNEMRLVVGLTWMDSSKFLAPVFLLVFVGLAALAQRRGPTGRLGAAGRTITFGSLALLVVATALEFWSFPWGSYGVRYEDATGLAGSDASGVIQLVVSFVFTIGLALFGADLVRGRAVPVLVALTLVAGGLTTVFLTPVFPVPGMAWLVLGFGLLRKPEPQRAG